MASRPGEDVLGPTLPADPGPAAPASGADPLGSPRFQVLRTLGAGGMGVVYEALDRTSNSKVAVKTLLRFSPQALLRFKHEFRSLQDLRHPNLVRYGELYESDGRWFFTMECLQGQDFLRHVRPNGTSLDEGRLRAALGQLWQGLFALHGAGKVHRDLKPGNVLVTPQGRLVLLDFGLVADQVHSAEWSESGLVGTVAYMAPEQADAAPPGPAADCYSAGVMLYEALTGRLPFSGPLFQVLRRKQSEDPPPPRELAHQVPADLNELCLALLQRDPTVRPKVVELLGGTSRSAGVLLEPEPPVPPFVGRQAELQALHQAFAASRSGQPITVLCKGESGIGKSALCAHFVRGLKAREPAVVVLAGRCYERESVPYKAIDGILDELSRFMRRLPREEAAALVPRWASLLCQVFPVLGRVSALSEAPRPARNIVDPQERRERLFQAVRELLTRLAERYPLVLTIDDFHWADPDGRQILAEVLRQPDAPALLLICACRPGYAQEGEPEFLGKAQRLDVLPLSIEEGAELVRRLQEQSGGLVADACSLAEEAGGQPLFIAELVRRGLPSGARPAEALRLEQALLSRVEQLGPGEQELLRHLAVAGTPLRAEALGRALGVGADEVRGRAARLRGSGLLRSKEHSGDCILDLYHDRVREALVQHLPPEVQRECHRHLAQALVVVPGADAETLARHFQAAGERELAAQHAERAADQAMSALAFRRATQLYQLTLELAPQQTDLRRRLGDALASDGRGPQAAEAYLFAAAAAPPPQALVLRTRAVEQLVRTGHLGPGLTTLYGVLDEMGIHLPRTPFRALVALIFHRLLLRLRGLRYRPRDPASMDESTLARVDICYSAALVLSGIDIVGGVDLHTQQLLCALRAGEPFRAARALLLEAIFTILSGIAGHRRAEHLLRLVDPAVCALDHPVLRASVAAARAVLHGEAGRFVEALAHTTHAVEILRTQCVGVACELGIMHSHLAGLLATLGEMTELGRLVGEVLHRSRDRGDVYQAGSMLYAGVMAALARDDVAEAKRFLARMPDPRQDPTAGRLLGQLHIDLYERQGPAGQGHTMELWPAVWATGIHRAALALRGRWTLAAVPRGAQGSFQVTAMVLRARCALAGAAAAPAAGRPRLLKAAELAVGRAELAGRAQQPWAAALVELLRAGIAALDGDTQGAAVRYADAAGRLSAAGFGLYAAAARRRQGEIIGGAAGQALIDEADAWMEGHGVKNPPRMCDMLAPAAPANCSEQPQGQPDKGGDGRGPG